MLDNINTNKKIETIKKGLWITIISVVVIIIAIVLILLFSDGKTKDNKNNINISEIKGAKEYTLEEYEALSPEEQALFPDRFNNMEEFNDWYKNVQEEAEEKLSVFDLGGRDPKSFSWDEYMAMTPEEQMTFPDCFDSVDGFNEWFEKAQNEHEETGSDSNTSSIDFKGKLPENFTWEDYMDLTPEEQAVFPDCFDNVDEFNKWFEKAQNEAYESENGSESSEVNLNGRKPEDFTWEDYKKLSIEEQMLFPDCFESYEDFKAWYEKNCPEE